MRLQGRVHVRELSPLVYLRGNSMNKCIQTHAAGDSLLPSLTLTLVWAADVQWKVAVRWHWIFIHRKSPQINERDRLKKMKNVGPKSRTAEAFDQCVRLGCTGDVKVTWITTVGTVFVWQQALCSIQMGNISPYTLRNKWIIPFQTGKFVCVADRSINLNFPFAEGGVAVEMSGRVWVPPGINSSPPPLAITPHWAYVAPHWPVCYTVQ